MKGTEAVKRIISQGFESCIGDFVSVLSTEKKVESVKLGTQTQSITCMRRISEETLPNGEKLDIAPAATLTIHTTGGHYIRRLSSLRAPHPESSESRERWAEFNRRLSAVELSREENPRASSGNEREGCSIIGNVQICWGHKNFTPVPSAPHVVANVNFSFMRSFGEAPVVSMSATTDHQPSQGMKYLEYGPTQITPRGIVDASFGEAQNRPAPASRIRIRYIAIGAPATTNNSREVE